MYCIQYLILIALTVVFARASIARPLPWQRSVSDGFGINIHFTKPRAGEMKMLQQSGIEWVRMDFTWAVTEKTKGQYDFSAYDELLNHLDEAGMKPLFILDYNNPLYDKGNSPHTDLGRAAFARWAAAAVAHYKGRPIIWELWNEPNIFFWKPAPNVDNYIKLVKATGEAIRAVDANAYFVGPATSTVDLPFLEACFKGGALQYWDAVTVHPYREQNPETVAEDYQQLRSLIRLYKTQGKEIPIISGEWGYSTKTGGINETIQAQYLARQWLINIANDIPLSIWYDWHNDGPDPAENEHNFGIVGYDYYSERNPVYDPKPAYHAAQTLAQLFEGYQFNKRLEVGDRNDYVMLFVKDKSLRLAAWTSEAPHEIAIPASAGTFEVTDYTGKVLLPLTAKDGELRITVSSSPLYLLPPKDNDLLTVAAAWQSLPLQVMGYAPEHVEISLLFNNPFSLAITINDGTRHVTVKAGDTYRATMKRQISRTSQDVALTWEFVGIGKVTQQTSIVPLNPVTITASLRGATTLMVEVANPSGEGFEGELQVQNARGIKLKRGACPIRFTPGQVYQSLSFTLDENAGNEYALAIGINDKSGSVIAAPVLARYEVLDTSAAPQVYDIIAEGNPQVASEQQIIATTIQEKNTAIDVMQIKYHFEQGWKYLCVQPRNAALGAIQGHPKALQMWVYSEEANYNAIRMRFKDATGQTFQPNGEKLHWRGWKLVTFPLTGRDASHWGGDGIGIIHYPIAIDTLFLLDSNTSRQSGNVYFSMPTLVY